jgi:hypothetical protein
MSRIVSFGTCNIINNIQGFVQAVVSSDEVRGLQINILETDNEDGFFGKYCPSIASSMSGFQMNDSALTVGAGSCCNCHNNRFQLKWNVQPIKGRPSRAAAGGK